MNQITETNAFELAANKFSDLSLFTLEELIPTMVGLELAQESGYDGYRVASAFLQATDSEEIIDLFGKCKDSRDSVEGSFMPIVEDYESDRLVGNYTDYIRSHDLDDNQVAIAIFTALEDSNYHTPSQVFYEYAYGEGSE